MAEISKGGSTGTNFHYKINESQRWKKQQGNRIDNIVITLDGERW